MDPALTRDVISILDQANDMTIATVRKDGYPQATTVSYVNDGLTIYFGCAAESQKAKNIARSDKVSLTVNLPYASWTEIRGLSIAGKAEAVTDPEEIDQVGIDVSEVSPDRAIRADRAGGDSAVPDHPGNHFCSRLPQGVWPHRSRQRRRLTDWA